MYKDRYFTAFSDLYLVEREVPKMRYITTLEVDYKKLPPAMASFLVSASSISNWLPLFVYSNQEYSAFAKSLLFASDELCWLDATGCIDSPL
jgi:hypothetical protein